MLTTTGDTPTNRSSGPSLVAACNQLVLPVAHGGTSLADGVGDRAAHLSGDPTGLVARCHHEVVGTQGIELTPDLLLHPYDPGRSGRRTDAEPRHALEHATIMAQPDHRVQRWREPLGRVTRYRYGSASRPVVAGTQPSRCTPGP